MNKKSPLQRGKKMINIPIEKIIQKITEQTNLSEEEVQKKINTKLEQLSGLISKEGAGHIIANELGVKIMQTEGILKIKDLLAGMRDVEIDCKALKKYDLRTFENAKGQGKVFKFLAGDETGIMLVVLWNDKTNLQEIFEEGDSLKIKQANVRDNNGKLEMHLGEQGEIQILKGTEIKTQKYTKSQRKKISELQENEENIEIFATVVQLFDPKFFKVNSEGRRIKEDSEDFSYGSVLNIFVDDGSDNIRVVLWKNQILNFLNITEQELLKFKDEPSLFEEYKNKMLGNMIKFIGRTTKNEMFGKLEFVANVVITDVKPEEEIKNLKNKTEQKEITKEKIKEKEESKPKKVEEPKILEDDDIISLEDIEDIEEDL